MKAQEEIIERLKGKKKYIILSRDFLCSGKEQFILNDIYAENDNEASEIVNEEIETNNSQDWIMTEKEFKHLKELIKNADMPRM